MSSWISSTSFSSSPSNVSSNSLSNGINSFTLSEIATGFLTLPPFPFLGPGASAFIAVPEAALLLLFRTFVPCAASCPSCFLLPTIFAAGSSAVVHLPLSCLPLAISTAAPSFLRLAFFATLLSDEEVFARASDKSSPPARSSPLRSCFLPATSGPSVPDLSTPSFFFFFPSFASSPVPVTPSNWARRWALTHTACMLLKLCQPSGVATCQSDDFAL
mmetsp:Transcript_133001/g.297654  ORF Transcript_133001/g.297654 Transcript_133001/m.297654 type:complete len:217 (-) Transcript_133001:423-1073(-)